MKQGFYIALFTIFLFSCKKENNCLISSGKPASETLYMDAFSSIEVKDFIDVNWQESSEYKIEIEGGENFIPGISYNIKKNFLVLKNNNGCKFMRRNVDDISVTVFCPFVDTLTVKGSGKILFKDTMKHNLWVNCIANQGTMNLKIDNEFTRFYLESGSNDIHVTGSTRYCNYYNAGIIHFYAKTFEVDSFRCHSRSKGITEIIANSWLHIEQNGESDINYWGNPPIVNVTSYSGDGKIISRN
ncbi:MAG: hypothetical protein CMP63_07710 [Flavobacteriales bacterium]|nr:hypothetical protein [Flavobacteriales bacterium]